MFDVIVNYFSENQLLLITGFIVLMINLVLAVLIIARRGISLPGREKIVGLSAYTGAVILVAGGFLSLFTWGLTGVISILIVFIYSFVQTSDTESRSIKKSTQKNTRKYKNFAIDPSPIVSVDKKVWGVDSEHPIAEQESEAKKPGAIELETYDIVKLNKRGVMNKSIPIIDGINKYIEQSLQQTNLSARCRMCQAPLPMNSKYTICQSCFKKHYTTRGARGRRR